MVKTVVVDQDVGMAKAEAPDILSSGEAGAGIIIGIYDSKTRSGYMLHEIYFSNGTLERQLEAIEEDYGTLGRQKVQVRGGSTELCGDEVGAMTEEKTYVEKMLGQHFKKVDRVWCPKGYSQELILNLGTRRFRTEVEPLGNITEGSITDVVESDFFKSEDPLDNDDPFRNDDLFGDDPLY